MKNKPRIVREDLLGKEYHRRFEGALKGFQGVSRGSRRFHWVSRGFKGFKGFQGVSRGLKGLEGLKGLGGLELEVVEGLEGA